MSPLKTQLLLTDGQLTPLGGMKLAGTIHEGSGTGMGQMRVLGSYALVLLIAGSGEYGDELGHRQTLGPGDLIWVFPDIAHFYGPTANAKWDEIYFVFEGPLFELWREQHVISPDRPVWHVEPVDFWAARLEEMTRPPKSLGWKGEFLQLSRWQSLIAEILLADQQLARETDPAWLARACDLLGHDGPPLALEDIARKVGLSYEVFRKRFAERMGITPAKYRQKRVIERACALLMRAELSHQDIANRLGFCDEFHFSKTFRRCMGFSPRVFRQKALHRSPT